MSELSYFSGVEVTHDEYRRIMQPTYEEEAPPPVSRGTRVSKRISNILPIGLRRSPARNSSERSVGSDNATSSSIEGQQSVANITIGSHDTVKASNRKEKKEPRSEAPVVQREKKGKRWKKFKRLMGVTKEVSQVSDDNSTVVRQHSLSADFSSEHNMKAYHSSDESRLRKRISSADVSRSGNAELSLDEAIKGRFDGIDVVSLGSARMIAFTHPSSKPPRDDPLVRSFTGDSVRYTSAQMVSDMVWGSAGKEHPEMILEGFLPGGEDRWIVRVDVSRTLFAMDHQPLLIKNTFEDGECVSATVQDPESTESMPIHELWNSMWGTDRPPPAPSHMSTPVSDHSEWDEQDDVIQLAAACSVPIDVDEDTFIVDTAQHLRSVHDIATIPLQRGHFEKALEIFSKILCGLEARHAHQPHHLIGSTFHNMGVIRMWQRKYHQCLSLLQKAVAARKRALPPSHPDIVVSLAREGLAYFALSRFEEANDSFEMALLLVGAKSASRAKILNNLGCVHYQKRDLIRALKAFTGALSIQRQWLDGPVRREPIVYDASVTLNNMGKVYMDQADYDMACYVYEEALLLQTTVFPKNHDVVIASLGSLALAKARNAEVKKALQIFNGVLRSQTARFGPDDPKVIETKGIMGYLYMDHFSYDDALRCLTQVMKWQKANLAPTHPALRKTKDDLKNIEVSLEGDVSVWI